jgi:hypothetical protein
MSSDSFWPIGQFNKPLCPPLVAPLCPPLVGHPEGYLQKIEREALAQPAPYTPPAQPVIPSYGSNSTRSSVKATAGSVPPAFKLHLPKPAARPLDVFPPRQSREEAEKEARAQKDYRARLLSFMTESELKRRGFTPVTDPGDTFDAAARFLSKSAFLREFADRMHRARPQARTICP